MVNSTSTSAIPGGVARPTGRDVSRARNLRSAERLVDAVEYMAAAESRDEVLSAVCAHARRISGSDGATLVLREGDRCFYADEDAMKPLWKGERFPLTSCISGWVMLNERPALIDDIYADERIPHAAYRPTFVTSLAMVPVGGAEPVAAIGNYWADRDRPDDELAGRLQIFAAAVASALERLDAS
jgi:GAF domain-containing protein